MASLHDSLLPEAQCYFYSLFIGKPCLTTTAQGNEDIPASRQTIGTA